jgi:Tol biopolymer transport system component
MTIKRILYTITLFVSTISFGQKSEKITGELSPIFDISPDNKNLVVSVSNGDNSTLYIYSFADNKLTQLTDTKGYYSRPVYSPKGDKIIFLSKGLSSETSDLCSISLDNKEIKKLTDGKMYVTEASFLPSGEKILYCGAGTITNYSPMARKAPHDLDLYSMEQDGTNSKKLTDFHAYQFASIEPNQKGDTILCKLIIKGTEGIYLLSLADTVQTKLEAVNNPRPEIGASFYGTPAFSKDNKRISFTAPYQLYTMNLANRECEEIWSSFGKDEQAMPIFSRFDPADKNILFAVLAIVNRQYNRNAKIFSYDITTKKLTQISIPLKN